MFVHLGIKSSYHDLENNQENNQERKFNERMTIRWLNMQC